jgi:hypothetical protein
MRRFGVEIPDQTMCGWMRQSAELLVPLYQRLKAFVLRSKAVGTDDTPVKVLDRRLSQNHSAIKLSFRSSLFHRTVNSVLTVCLSPGTTALLFPATGLGLFVRGAR